MMKQQRLSTRMRSYSTSSLEQISHDEGRSNTKRHSHHMSKGSYTAESTVKEAIPITLSFRE